MDKTESAFKFESLLKSFTNQPGGSSARKLSAFAAVSIGCLMTCIYCDSKVLPEILIIWLSFAALCLGMVTTEQLIALKNGGSKPDDKPNETH